MEQPGGVGALQFPSVMTRSFLEGYPIPRGALDVILHTRRLRERGGGVPQAPQNAGIGWDVLPQNVGCHMLSHLLWWHVQSSLRMTLITHQTQQLTVRLPPLFLFAEHPYSTQAVV
jgi:hypothetical protein